MNLSDLDFDAPTHDEAFSDKEGRTYLSEFRTCRLEIEEFLPNSEDTYWKFHQILQGSKEEILAAANKIGEEMNAMLRISIPIKNNWGRVIDRRVVWSN